MANRKFKKKRKNKKKRKLILREIENLLSFLETNNRKIGNYIVSVPLTKSSPHLLQKMF